MLLRRRLTHTALAVSASALALSGCARDIGELDPPVDLTTVVTAQFDPTNPIPVLQLVPSPTFLAQDPATGLLAMDPNRPGQKVVEPEPCELPTSAQCLAFVDGWPTTTPITLFFSGELDETTIKSGIKVFERTATAPGLAPVEYEFRTGARDPVNAACQTVYNYTAADEAPGIQVQLAPTTPLKPGTQYFVFVESHADGGLRTATGNVVEPSALFHLLNVTDDAGDPVTAEGQINSALLRSNVQGLVLRRAFPGRTVEELSTEELAAFAAGVQATGKTLYGLYLFFDGVIDLAVQANIVDDRNKLILTNTWSTGRDATTVAFDPANGVVPFPNSQLLTTGDVTGQVQVNLPNDPNGSATAQALIRGLNTLNGFSTTAPMTINFTRNIDASTLDGNILLYRANGAMLDPAPHPISISTSSAAAGGLATVVIQPLLPLQDNAHYVVVVKRGIKDSDGFDVGTQSTFKLLMTPAPLISGTTVLPPVEPALQCSFVGITGSLGTDPQVQGLATQIETLPEMGGLGHSKWLTAIGLATAEPVAVPAGDLLFAYSYNTQDITGLMETVRDQLLPAWDTATPGPRLLFTGIELTGTASIANAVGLVPNLCLPLCQTGQLVPDIAPADCGSAAAPNPAIYNTTLCRTAEQLIAGNLARARLYLMRTYRSTVGSPYTAGTFTPQTLMSPVIENTQVWILEGNGAAPANGRPAAVVQHGLGSQKEAGFLAANTLTGAYEATVQYDNGVDFASGDWVTVLMDLPFHGSRASDITRNVGGNEIPCVDTSSTGLPNIDPGNVTCDPQTGVCTGGCDDVQDSSGTGFLSTNVFGARDNFRQSLIDHLTLLYTLKQEGQAGGVLDGVIDGSHVGYIGQSLGGITGGNLAAVAPDNLQTTVLNVAGGSLTTVLLNTVPQISAGLFVALNAAGVCEYNEPGNPISGCQDTPAFRQFLLTAQWALDPGDPLATSVGVNRNFGPENVLMQMVMPDKVVTNQASYFLAGAYGFLPPENNPRANHFNVYDLSALPAANTGSGCHGFLFAPFTAGGMCGECLSDALCNTTGAQLQALSFLESGGTTIPSTKPLALNPLLQCTCQ